MKTLCNFVWLNFVLGCSRFFKDIYIWFVTQIDNFYLIWLKLGTITGIKNKGFLHPNWAVVLTDSKNHKWNCVRKLRVQLEAFFYMFLSLCLLFVFPFTFFCYLFFLLYSLYTDTIGINIQFLWIKYVSGWNFLLVFPWFFFCFLFKF